MTDSILLTGGFGNIGGRFASYLTNLGFNNLVLSSRKHREPPSWAPSAKISICDLSDQDSITRSCEGVKTVFHFAALNDRDCASDARLAEKVNVTGTFNLAKAAASCGVEHIIYMSTIHVYGSPLVGHINENSPTAPQHPYGVTHLLAEQVLAEFSHSFKSTVIRSGNGFGYPMTFDVDIWQIVVNDLCIQAVRDKELVLRSPSNTERNFVTLADICRALHFVGLKSPISHGSETFNLGSTRSRKLAEMSKLIADRSVKILGIRPRIVESVAPTDEETSLEFDSSKLRDRGFLTEEGFELEIDGILDLVKRTYESN
jgi:UDP-glucose 4-epimerase